MLIEHKSLRVKWNRILFGGVFLLIDAHSEKILFNGALFVEKKIGWLNFEICNEVQSKKYSLSNFVRTFYKWHPGQLKKWKSWEPFWSYLPIQPIYIKIGPNWQCCLADSSKTAPRILIFSIAMDADYSFLM